MRKRILAITTAMVIAMSLLQGGIVNAQSNVVIVNDDEKTDVEINAVMPNEFLGDSCDG